MRPLLLVAASVLALSSAAISPAHAGPADYPHGKLPDAAKPLDYRLDLTIVPSQDSFSGHAEIDIDLKAAATQLFMHGRDLAVTKAWAVQDGKAVAITWDALDAKTDDMGVAQITFAKPMKAGKVTLKFDYSAPFGDGPAGLYHIKVGDDWYAWTQFESIDARAAFPSFDQPGYKTPFTVSITTEKGFTTVSNAPETGTTPAGDLVKHSFAETKPLPTYLVALMAGPFVTKEGVAPPTPQRSYPLPIRAVATKPNADKLDFVVAETPSIVAHLEAYFNKPFPYPKLDQIASPVMPGAMENAGADTYADGIIMLDAGSPTAQRKEFGMVVSHELSHQWFGDYVTPAWWDDIWLNESFANWMGYRIGNEWKPDLNIAEGAVDEGFGAMGQDALKVGRPIHQAITDNGDIDSAFDGITYGKGGQVIAMIAGYLGDEKFRDGVRLHMERHPYGNADSEQFFAALADGAKDPKVLDSMKSFVNQQGFPTVDIKRVKDENGGDKLVATQTRYARLGTTLDPQTWTIPLCIRHGDTRTCTLMDQTTEVVSAPGDGVIMPNAGGTGYYRFTLEPQDWEALIKSGDTLSGPEGIAMLDSLFGQFSQGKGNAAQLIEAARIMADNPDSEIATSAGEYLSGYKGRGLIDDATLPAYRKVFADIYAPKLAALGFDPKAGVYANDDPDKQQLRRNLVGLVADDAHDAGVRKQLSDAAAAWVNGDKGAVDQTYLGLALAIYVEDGGLDTAKAMFDRAMTASDEAVRSPELRSVLSGATPDTATWVFGILDDKRLRQSDKLGLIGGLMGQPKTRDMTFEWLKTNYDAMTKGAGIFSAGRLASSPGGYCSAEKADEVDAFLRPHVEASGRGVLPFNRMLEGIRNCGILKDARMAEINKAFIDAH